MKLLLNHYSLIVISSYLKINNNKNTYKGKRTIIIHKIYQIFFIYSIFNQSKKRKTTKSIEPNQFQPNIHQLIILTIQ